MSSVEITERAMSRRQVLTLLGASALGATLAGCGSTLSTGGPYKGKFVIISIADPKQSAPLVDAIQRAHPGVTVEWRQFPSERFTQLFSAVEVARDQVDILDLNGQDLRRYAVGNRMVDLSGFHNKDRFTDVALNTYTIDNKLWALPRGGSSGFPFFYNKKLLQQVGFTKEPQTYNDLKMLAPELKRIGVAPFVHPGKNIYLWPVWNFWALAQTTNNQAVDITYKTLSGDMKFTDPEHVAALELIYRYAQDNMFIQGVNSLDSDGANVNFFQGKAAFYYNHSSFISTYRNGNYKQVDLNLIPPLLSVSDSTVKRQLPGGTGNALGIYSKIDSARKQLALDVIDLMTSDQWSKWQSTLNADPASCNKNVQASTDTLAIKYAQQCATNQVTYLDWYWPPEITLAYQQNIQGMISGTVTPDQAAKKIQAVMDNSRQDGYTFQK